MQIKRLNNLSKVEAAKIRDRQKRKTLNVYYDDDGYICYDLDEYNAWKPKKVGRKPKSE